MKKQTFTLEQMIVRNGARTMAIKIIDRKLIAIAGLGKDDLPDSSDLCEKVDALEEVLSESEVSRPDIEAILADIDEDYVQQLVYS